jgi:hypothetical protein
MNRQGPTGNTAASTMEKAMNSTLWSLSVLFSIFAFTVSCATHVAEDKPAKGPAQASPAPAEKMDKADPSLTSGKAGANDNPETGESAACTSYKTSIANRNFFIDNVTGLEMKYLNTRKKYGDAVKECFNLTPTHNFKLATETQLANLGHLFVEDTNNLPCNTDIWGTYPKATHQNSARYLMPGATRISGGASAKFLCILQ